MIRLPKLRPGVVEAFPDPRHALIEPNGLLAFGGDLSVERLLLAYRSGIFPWFNPGEPILWWSPDPRCVFHTDQVHVSRSTRKLLARTGWTTTMDRAFGAVIRGCAGSRYGVPGTWIGPGMIEAYEALHAAGHAHSLEVWAGERLVGGIYGVQVGRMFFGESMFSAATGGSKAALIGLCAWLHERGMPLLDAQVANEHTLSMGAVEMSRVDFLTHLPPLVIPAQAGTQCESVEKKR
jgi:leucyl/phenylalanyl-tRNA--protein transferase